MDPAEALILTIRRSVVGDDEAVAGPFGIRRVTYADYTASGRSLTFLEDYLRDAVLPLYANTHTESSGTGLQTTRFRAEARELIRRAVGATDEHAVIFVGSGSTGAINRLVDVLQIRLPADLDDRYGLRAMIPPAERPLVLVGPYEHHSNELPWRESVADVVVIHEDPDGRIDAGHLAAELERHADRALKIGSFSAASNVTGILSDVRGISALLHAHGALACWDYAAAAPYVAIDMAGDSKLRKARDVIVIEDLRVLDAEAVIGGGHQRERGRVGVEHEAIAAIADGVRGHLKPSAQRARRDVLDVRRRGAKQAVVRRVVAVRFQQGRAA